MISSLKLLLVASVCLALGIGATLAWQRYTALSAENERLKAAQSSPLVVASASPTSDESVATGKKMAPPSPTPEDIATGSITGALGYPSEGIPPLEVVAFQKGDLAEYVKLDTQSNQSTYTLSGLKPGKYVVVAYLKSHPDSAGGYSQMVPCGLLASCTDHSLIEVEVKSGETTKGVDIKDWYAPAGTFPAQPK